MYAIRSYYARLAPAALDVEAEAARLVPARLAFRQAGEPVADIGEGASVGRRVGARGAADGGLVDVDDLVEVLQAEDLLDLPRLLLGPVEALGQRPKEGVDDQGRLARARITSYNVCYTKLLRAGQRWRRRGKSRPASPE